MSIVGALPRGFAVAVAVVGQLCLTPVAAADPGTGSQAQIGSASSSFIARAQWSRMSDGRRSLRVYPTSAGRAAARLSAVGSTARQDAERAWSDVLTLAPDAETPGMRAQFLCHWQIAEYAQPGKTSWNLEPWRPVVDDAAMFASGCNPGGPEELS